jgi:hypothetical protein
MRRIVEHESRIKHAGYSSSQAYIGGRSAASPICRSGRRPWQFSVDDGGVQATSIYAQPALERAKFVGLPEGLISQLPPNSLVGRYQVIVDFVERTRSVRSEVVGIEAIGTGALVSRMAHA